LFYDTLLITKLLTQSKFPQNARFINHKNSPAMLNKKIVTISSALHPWSFVLLLLIIVLPNTPALADFSPLPTRDQNPFNLIHGQPLPVAADVADKGQLHINSSLSITNTLNIEQVGNDSIFLDYESYQINLGLQYGLGKSWAVQMNLPIIHQGGGFLDSTINSWHDLFNLPQADRPNVADDQYRIQRVENNTSISDLQSESTRLGDLQLNLGNEFYQSEKTTLSLWAGLKLPTGDAKKLTSNDAIDLSLWLAANHQLSQNWYFNSNAGLVFPAVYITGDKTRNNDALETQVVFGHAMLAWQLVEWLDLKIQVNGHTSYYENNSLRLLGSTYIGTFGASFHVNSCNDIDASFSEDIKVSASPDVSFMLNWRHRSACL